LSRRESEAPQNSEDVFEKADTGLKEDSSCEQAADPTGESQEKLLSDGGNSADGDLDKELPASSGEFGENEKALPPSTEEHDANLESNEQKTLKISEVKLYHTQSSTSFTFLLVVLQRT
jgi:hypothetical protein